MFTVNVLNIISRGGMSQVVELWFVKSDVVGPIPSVYHKVRIVRIIIPACLIKKPNGTLSRMYMQTYARVK